MIQYRKILELDAKGVTQRTITSSTGHSRDKIREVIKRAKVRAITTINYKYINFEQKAAIIDCLTRKLYENCLKPLKKSLIHLSLK